MDVDNMRKLSTFLETDDATRNLRFNKVQFNVESYCCGNEPIGEIQVHVSKEVPVVTENITSTADITRSMAWPLMITAFKEQCAKSSKGQDFEGFKLQDIKMLVRCFGSTAALKANGVSRGSTIRAYHELGLVIDLISDRLARLLSQRAFG